VGEFETGDEDRGWPIWRPLGGVAAAITALIIVLLVLTQCGGSSVRANPLCAPDAVPKQTVDALRDAATATREAQQDAGKAPTARPVGGPSETPAPSPTVVSPEAPATGAPSGVPGTPGTAATATRPPASAPSPTAAPPDGGDDLEAALLAANGSEAPFFAQNSPLWGGEEYDHSYTAENGCPGPNLANCGCALTSVTNVMAYDGVAVMPDGQPMNPSTVNAWASAGAQVTQSGVVSQGFAFGGAVIWDMALAISGGGRRYAAEHALPPQPVVGLSLVGSATEQQVEADLDRGQPVILSTPRQSHWFTATGTDGDGQWLFWDPYYRDQIRKSGSFGPTSIHYASDAPPAGLVRYSLVISTKAKTFKVTDKDGKPIPGAMVVKQVAWEDPTCEHNGADPDFVVNQVYLPVSQEVIIEVEDDGPTTIVVHEYGSDGSVQITVDEGDGDQRLRYEPGGLSSSTAGTSTTGVPAGTPAQETPASTPVPATEPPTGAPPPLQPSTVPPASAPPPPATAVAPATLTPLPTVTMTTIPPTATLTPDLPGPPAYIALSASPSAIPCDGASNSTVTAVITDLDGELVVDGTPVSFAVVALGTANPSTSTTDDGSASTVVTPLSGSVAGVTLVVTSGDAEASMRIDCVIVSVVSSTSAGVTPSTGYLCPFYTPPDNAAMFTFTGSITATGPIAVSYRWERSDGASSSPQTVTFAGAGTKTVTTTWTLFGAYAGWERLVILSPNALTSNQANFEAVESCLG